MKKLETGDWFVVHGQGIYDSITYYVVDHIGDTYWINSPSLLNDNVNVLTQAQIDNSHCEFIGKSKLNPWYKWFGWTGLVHPVKLA